MFEPYVYTSSLDERLLDHADHIYEWWHAYLDGDFPDWVNGADSGMCCHDCKLIIVEVIAS